MSFYNALQFLGNVVIYNEGRRSELVTSENTHIYYLFVSLWLL